MLNYLEQTPSIYSAVVKAIIAFLPALIANCLPVLAIGKIVKKPTPVDLDHRFIDGRPILGRSKSWEGLILGVAGGFIVGLGYSAVLGNVLWTVYGGLMGFGAMFGDALNSFIKRRLNISPGEPFIPMDQLSFILVAYVLVKALNLDILVGLTLSLTELAIIVYVTLVLHPLTNLIAYKLGLKDKPW